MEYFGQEIGAEAGVLYDNSTNIVQLIRNTYEVCQHIFYCLHLAKILPQNAYNRITSPSCIEIPLSKSVASARIYC